MTEEQKEALDHLMKVECNIDPKPAGCGNQWCEARKKIANAFGLNKEEEKN